MINKQKIAKLLPHDKMIHFFVGDCIKVITMLICSFWIDLLISSIIALVVVTIAAFLNEVRDEIKKKGAFSVPDILCTVLSSVTTIVIILIN
jgi:hypothetical protein